MKLGQWGFMVLAILVFGFLSLRCDDAFTRLITTSSLVVLLKNITFQGRIFVPGSTQSSPVLKSGTSTPHRLRLHCHISYLPVSQNLLRHSYIWIQRQARRPSLGPSLLSPYLKFGSRPGLCSNHCRNRWLCALEQLHFQELQRLLLV